MSTVTVYDEEFTLTKDQQARYDELIAFGVEESTALQAVTGRFEDVHPEPVDG